MIDTQLITEATGLPPVPDRSDPDHKPQPFWDKLESPEIKQAAVFLVLNEIRQCDATLASGEHCRAVLSRCQGIMRTMDFASSAQEFQKKQPDEEQFSEDMDDLRG